MNKNVNVESIEITITELSMSGNMRLFEMLSRKTKWKTVDDGKPGFVKRRITYDQDFTNVTLEP